MHQVTKPRGRHAVFVDPSGRRRRLARWAGVAAGSVLAAYLAIVAFGLVTGSGAPLTPWPAAKPSHREAAPDTPRPRPRSAPSARRQVSDAPSGAAPATPHTAPATTAPATTASPRPGRGRAYGLTKGPHPKRS